jgi:hypothetical protein
MRDGFRLAMDRLELDMACATVHDDRSRQKERGGLRRIEPIAAFVALATIMVPVAARAQEAGSARVIPIAVSGDPAARFSLVILGDGYTAAEMARFRSHVEKHLNVLWSLEPFRSYRNYVNVYAVEIVSGESGITCDPAHRERRATPLRLYFSGGCENPNARGILVDQETARAYARMATPHFDQILTIANTDTYGGIGGSTATTSGGNALGPYITPHELGHSLGRLQDEYTYSERGVAGAAYTGDEPASIHHTLLTEQEMRSAQRKWWRWLGEASEAGGVIGRFPGGQQRVSGVWRPSRHSMMISLGYYFDQVSLERMVQRISGQVELIAASTPADSPRSAREVIWVETAHPVYHELELTWQIDGRTIPAAANRTYLSLSDWGITEGEHTVSVKVVDPTPFVRDSMIRDTSLTATRSWTVRSGPSVSSPAVRVAFTASTQTLQPVSGKEVVYVETTHPADRVLPVEWRLNGRALSHLPQARTLPLAQLSLPAGSHTLTATVSDPEKPGESQTLEWTIDNTGPEVSHAVSQPVASVVQPGGDPHYFMRDQFTMKLEPRDDQSGYVVAEFRVNGDGWHHYYGWPDASPDTPFLFTPRGTTIKELVYGSLSSEGLSPQPWEPREPGWGTHRVEYRARDAAGNIGETREFRVTIRPSPACTAMVEGRHPGDLVVDEGVTCLKGAHVSGRVSVAAGATLIAANARIDGALASDGAGTVELVGTSIAGPARISGTTGELIVFGSVLDGELLLADNRMRTAAIVSGNRVGRISCTGNAQIPVDLGTPNTAQSTSGQCAAQ